MSLLPKGLYVMEKHYIESLHVKQLWGSRDYSLTFNRDINIIIGPNASGKTTLINLLYNALSVNIPRLLMTHFDEIELTLTPLSGKKHVLVHITQKNREMAISLDNKIISTLPIPPSQVSYSNDLSWEAIHSFQHRHLLRQTIGDPHIESLRSLVSIAWLPVSRRSAMMTDNETPLRMPHGEPLDAIDERLSMLIDGLREYRLSLNSGLSDLHREFQRHALETILYNKMHDRINNANAFPGFPSPNDKKKLLKAFRDVGLANPDVERKIDEHFVAANEALQTMLQKDASPDLNTIFILPLLKRTAAMVEHAQELEQKKDLLFAHLHNFLEIINTRFLRNKNVDVTDRGEIVISASSSEDLSPLDWRLLSSGEKQLLILLTEALVTGMSPVVYIADEPELSLHVEWQEELLRSLSSLAPAGQFIVATHSPDIVASFGDKVIDLARL